MHKQRLAILIAAGLGALATFMPWVKVPIIGTINGTSGDGWATLILFAIPLVLSLLKDRSKELSGGQLIVAVIPGIFAAMIGIWKIVDFNAALSGLDGNPFAEMLGAGVSIGFGLYLVILAGLALPVITFLFAEKADIEEMDF